MLSNNFMCITRSNAFEAAKKQHTLMSRRLQSMKHFASTKMQIGQYYAQP